LRRLDGPRQSTFQKRRLYAIIVKRAAGILGISLRTLQNRIAERREVKDNAASG
jgi:hypothetical protein